MDWTIFSGLIIGLLLGFVMQRTRFCLTGGFRDMYVQKNNKMFLCIACRDYDTSDRISDIDVFTCARNSL